MSKSQQIIPKDLINNENLTITTVNTVISVRPIFNEYIFNIMHILEVLNFRLCYVSTFGVCDRYKKSPQIFPKEKFPAEMAQIRNVQIIFLTKNLVTFEN